MVVEVDAGILLGERRFELLADSFLFGIVPGHEAERAVRQLAQRLEILILVPARAHAQHRHRRPALLDQFAGEQDRVVEAADHQQRFGAGRLGLGDLDREVARRRIVGDRLGDLVGHVELRQHRADAASVIAMPKVSLTCMNTAVFGAEPVICEDFLLVEEGVAEDHRPRSGNCGTRTCSPAR